MFKILLIVEETDFFNVQKNVILFGLSRTLPYIFTIDLCNNLKLLITYSLQYFYVIIILLIDREQKFKAIITVRTFANV